MCDGTKYRLIIKRRSGWRNDDGGKTEEGPHVFSEVKRQAKLNIMNRWMNSDRARVHERPNRQSPPHLIISRLRTCHTPTKPQYYNQATLTTFCHRSRGPAGNTGHSLLEHCIIRLVNRHKSNQDISLRPVRKIQFRVGRVRGGGEEENNLWKKRDRTRTDCHGCPEVRAWKGFGAEWKFHKPWTMTHLLPTKNAKKHTKFRAVEI